MKKILFAAIVLLMAVGCNKQANTYTIQGVVKDTTDINGKTAYLINVADERKLDSCVVKEGHFTFKGKADSMQIAMVELDYLFAYIIPEKGTIDLSLNGYDEYKVSGTPLNNALQAFNSELKIVNNDRQAQIGGIYADSTLNSKEKKVETETASNKYDEVSQLISDRYFEDNRGNSLGIYVLSNMPLHKMPSAQIDSLINLLPPAAKKFNYLNQIRDTRYKQETVVVGTMFVDFSGVDANGKETKLSDYAGKGNYVLIDFWASWCGPCRQSMPALKEIQEKYKEKGLVVLGINISDEKKSFDISVAELGITWPQICQFDGNDTATSAYGISSIPTLILFDPDGKIAARKISTDEAKELLKKAYGFLTDSKSLLKNISNGF